MAASSKSVPPFFTAKIGGDSSPVLFYYFGLQLIFFITFLFLFEKVPQDTRII